MHVLLEFKGLKLNISISKTYFSISSGTSDLANPLSDA